MHVRTGGVVDGGGSAAEDDSRELAGAQDLGGDLAAEELAEDVQLPHAARDQVAVLRAEVQDRDLRPRGLKLGGHREPGPRTMTEMQSVGGGGGEQFQSQQGPLSEKENETETKNRN